MKSSKQIELEIEQVFTTKPELYQLFHADKWLSERAQEYSKAILKGVRAIRPPMPPSANYGRITGQDRIVECLPINDTELARIEAARTAIQCHPDFQAAAKLFGQLYQKLAEAKAAEAAEIIRLEKEAQRLAAEADIAEAEAEAKIAEVRKPVHRIMQAARDVGARLRELTS